MFNGKKCAVVTGGSHGIGSGICEVLAREGYDVAFTYHSNLDGAKQTKEICEKLGARAFYRYVDVRDAKECEEGIAALIEDLGSVDLLVNNAGYTLCSAVYDATEEFYDNIFRLNWRAPMLCAKVAVNYMVDHGIRGSVINISSSRSKTAYPEDHAYGGLKAALNRTTESMALQFAPYGIRANVIAPGATVIDRPYDEANNEREALNKKIPLQRSGTPEDIGNAVAFLASDKASYITGAFLIIDGGLTIPGIPETMDPIMGDAGWDTMSFYQKKAGKFREPKDHDDLA